MQKCTGYFPCSNLKIAASERCCARLLGWSRIINSAQRTKSHKRQDLHSIVPQHQQPCRERSCLLPRHNWHSQTAVTRASTACHHTVGRIINVKSTNHFSTSRDVLGIIREPGLFRDQSTLDGWYAYCGAGNIYFRKHFQIPFQGWIDEGKIMTALIGIWTQDYRVGGQTGRAVAPDLYMDVSIQS